MYVEEELFNWIIKKYKKANMNLTEKELNDILENCGVWYSFEGIRYETEDDMSLEDCFREYWYVIDKNKICFTNPDDFTDDLDEYLGSY